MRARVGIPVDTFHPGAIAGVITSRYYHVALACAVVAVLHFVAEWLYMGRPRRKFALGLVAALLVLTLIGRNAIQPSLENLNRKHYSANVQLVDRESAGKSFRILHILSIALNIITIGGLIVYVSRVSSSSETLRFVRPVQFGR